MTTTTTFFFIFLTSACFAQLVPCPTNCEPPFVCHPTNGYCVCAHSRNGHSLTWDIPSHSCALMEGQPCSSTSAPFCRSNTTCARGICRCESAFLLRDGFGGCSLSYGQPCSPSNTDDPCSIRFLLHCSPSHGQCRCRGEGRDHIWDSKLSKCVSLIGSVCELGTAEDRLECVATSKCLQSSSDAFPRCTCPPNSSSDRLLTTCFQSHGQPCSEKQGQVCDKSRQLICGNDGICGCEFYGQMEWNGESCRMLAGEFCDLNGTVYKCVDDAVCVPHHSHVHSSSFGNDKGKCACIPGKRRTSSGKCSPLRGRGMPCSYAGDCDSSSFLACLVGEEVGFGSCECEPTHTFWDEDVSLCVIRPGHSCQKEGSRCAKNGYCDPEEFCNCEDGFILDYTTSACISTTEADTEDPHQTTSRSTPPSTQSSQIACANGVAVTETERFNFIVSDATSFRNLSPLLPLHLLFFVLIH